MVSCRPAMCRGILGSEKSPFPYTYSLPPLLLLKQQHIISTRVAIMHPIYLLPLRVHIGLSPIWNTALESFPIWNTSLEVWMHFICSYLKLEPTSHSPHMGSVIIIDETMSALDWHRILSQTFRNYGQRLPSNM